MSEGNNYRTVSSRRVLREARGLLKKDRSFWLRVYLFMLPHANPGMTPLQKGLHQTWQRKPQEIAPLRTKNR